MSVTVTCAFHSCGASEDVMWAPTGLHDADQEVINVYLPEGWVTKIGGSGLDTVIRCDEHAGIDR